MLRAGRVLVDVVLGLLLLPVLLVVARARRSPTAPWVISGHRGRAIEDNAGELHAFVRAHTGQAIVWIADAPVVARLRGDGHPALVRNSLAARLTLLRAPVAIYSHGDDDLDQIGHIYLRFAARRIYLNHGLNVYKAGYAYTPHYQAASSLGRWLARRVMVDFDWLLASSAHERDCFALSFPHRATRIVDHGGGAHLDGFLRLSQTPPTRTIYWFPTHRDAAADREGLYRTVEALTRNEALNAWLREHRFTFRIGTHINTSTYPVTVSAPFEIRTLDTLKADLAVASLFVSDYSSLLADFLVFDRPTVSFVFDRDSYLKNRLLFSSIEQFATGPVCETIDEFVAAIVSMDWASDEPWAERRRLWRDRLFPIRSAHYAERCYQAIERLSRGLDP